MIKLHNYLFPSAPLEEGASYVATCMRGYVTVTDDDVIVGMVAITRVEADAVGVKVDMKANPGDTYIPVLLPFTLTDRTYMNEVIKAFGEGRTTCYVAVRPDIGDEEVPMQWRKYFDVNTNATMPYDGGVIVIFPKQRKFTRVCHAVNTACRELAAE